MRSALVLMTALLPTTGHADIIEFAAALPDTRVWVLVNTRSFEPIGHTARLAALSEQVADCPNVTVVGSANDAAPQQPQQHRDFWRWWVDEINRNCAAALGKWDYLVASEPYGIELARALGAEFVSYDLGRTLNPAAGSNVRADPWGQWQRILPGIRREAMVTVTLFGQESVGKTTLARQAAQLLKVSWLPEWARLHLETVGPQVDAGVMATVSAAQAAWQQAAYRRAAHPVLFQDTDLYSTIGYYEILGLEPPAALRAQAERLASPLYIVLPDDIAFVPDPQRFGGNARESAMEYWVRLLEEVGQRYLIAPSGSAAAKAEWIADQARTLFDERWEPIRRFARD